MKEIKPPKKKTTLTDKIDNLIGVFSPQKAFRRKMYRMANKLVLGKSYRGAEKNRLRQDWLPGGNSPDEDILSELPDLRERSRDLNRNDGVAAGITSTMVTNVVGTGIKPQSRIDKENLGIDDATAIQFQKRAERCWEKWVPYADSAERMDFYEIQQLIDRQILENGEVIILPLMLKEKYRPYSLALEVIESDRLVTPSDKRSEKSIRSGVKIGARGQPVSYFIQKTHPGDSTLKLRTPNSDKCIEIPARNEYGRPNVIHLYWIQRPGQTRGVPFFAPILTYFKDLADYLEAELVAARIAACFSLFIESEDAANMALNRSTETTSANTRIEDLEPGMVEYLNPGEKISSFSPERPGASFEPFVDKMLRMIGAALGLPYELVSKDFSKTNYSSARAALLEARRYFRVRQEWISRKLCQPVWDMVIEEAYLRKELDAPNFYTQKQDWCRTRWITPGWAWIDPLKEVKAAQEAVDNNLSSLADEAAAQGKDWEEIMEQNAREDQKRKELGLQKPQKNNDSKLDQKLDERKELDNE